MNWSTIVRTEQLKETITRNTEEIVRLHRRIHETLSQRDGSAAKAAEWRDACAEFHIRYNALAFHGGWEGALQRIIDGDPEAMEVAICFLELRPYFFRSGYMWKDILRKCKRAPLSKSQRERFEAVIKKREEWQAQHPMPYPVKYSSRQRLVNRARFTS